MLTMLTLVEDQQERGGFMYLVSTFIITVIAIVAVFKIVLEVIVFLNFDLGLNINIAPIFLDRPDSFFNSEKPLLLSMMLMALLTTMLLMMIFSFPSPTVDSVWAKATATTICSYHHR